MIEATEATEAADGEATAPEPPKTSYFRKMLGSPEGAPLDIPRLEVLGQAWFGAFSFMLLLAILHYAPMKESDYTLVLGSFGATAVLLFGAPSAPLSQPRCALLGQLIACAVGVSTRLLLVESNSNHKMVILAVPVSVSLTLTIMQLTRSTHPPGGGTAAIAVLAAKGSKISTLGFALLAPVASSALISVVVAVLVNNVYTSYPTHWFVKQSERKGERDVREG